MSVKHRIAHTYLCNEHNDNHDQADPGSSNTKDCPEWDLVKGVTVVLPCVPETDMGEANAAPGEECCQTGKRLKPVEGDRSTGIKSHEGKRRPCEDEDGGPQRSASTVDIGEEAGSVALLSERTQCTRATVNTRETNGDNRQHDDDVGEVGESNDTGALGNDDEWRRFHINHAAAQELRVGVLDEQTHKSERQDVEECDAPENLLDRGGQRSRRVFGLGSSEADELSTREREGSSDENSTETNKVGKCAWVRPRFASLISIVTGVNGQLRL